MEVGHSRLLKYILPEFNYKTKMADHNTTDSNVEEVPAVQTIRKTLNSENGECEHIPQDLIATVRQIDVQSIDDINDAPHNKNSEGKSEDRKARTKIPVSRFRQTVDKVKAERRASKDNKEESHTTTRRSSIPKPTRPAPAKPERKTITKPKPIETNIELTNVEPEDEFAKLYEQTVNSPVNIDVSLLNPKLEDPEKVEYKFEEIIHDYDEKKGEPRDVEKRKKSKIPFLRRQSLQDDTNSKIIAARDKVRQGSHLIRSDDSTEKLKDDQNNNVFERTEKKTDTNNQPNEAVTQHTKTDVTSSRTNEDVAIKVVSTATVTEVEDIKTIDKMEPKHQILIENIQKECVKVGIPVFDSYTYENMEKIEGDKTVEVKNVLSYTPHNSDLQIDEISNEILITENLEPDSDFDDHNDVDILKPEVDEQKETEDATQEMKEREHVFEDPMLRKNGRKPININVPLEVNKNDIEIDTGSKPSRKESVLSKIALFERNRTVKTKIPEKESKLPTLTIDILKTEKVHVHTPLIVDEVYKCEPTDLNNKDNKADVTTNGGENMIEIVKAEMVLIEPPELVLYNKDDNAQISKNTIQDTVISEEVLPTMLRKYQPNDEGNFNNNSKDVKHKDTNKSLPLVVPKFVPVKEVLKRYESLNDQNQNRKPAYKPKMSINEIRHVSKNNGNYRSLDTMFAHHEKPVSDILKDIYTPEISNGDKTDNVFFPKELSNTNGKKDFTKRNDVTNDIDNVNETIGNLENTDITANNDNTAKFKLYDFSEEFKKPELEYTTIPSGDDTFKSLEFIQDHFRAKDMRGPKSLAVLDLGDAVKGKVNNLIRRLNSYDLLEEASKNQSKVKDLPRKRSVSEKIALFERKLTPAKEVSRSRAKPEQTVTDEDVPADIQAKIEELLNAKLIYGSTEIPTMELAGGMNMPVLAVGTALLDPRLVYHVVCAAIDIGYRAIDTAYIYGNEAAVGEAIRAKINDGTVKREDLFIIGKLWSTFHRTDLVQAACKASLRAMGLQHFDLYLIHNPMSFKEGGGPLPKIATVLQYSQHDFLDAWYGMEALGARVRALGVSNFNSHQIRRLLDRARVKPVVNQVECHPYLTQQKLDNFCDERNIKLSCYGVLGSKGTPAEFKSSSTPVIDDPLVQVMASGLNVTPAQLLLRYQIQCGHNVVVKASSAAHLWDNLQSLTFRLTDGQVDALHALNRNKRTFTFTGMGDTHKNYPFNVAF